MDNWEAPRWVALRDTAKPAQRHAGTSALIKHVSVCGCLRAHSLLKSGGMQQALEWCAPCWAPDWDLFCQIWFLPKHKHTCSVYSIQVEGWMEGGREGGALCRPALLHGRLCPWLYGSWSTCSFGNSTTWEVGREFFNTSTNGEKKKKRCLLSCLIIIIALGHLATLNLVDLF